MKEIKADLIIYKTPQLIDFFNRQYIYGLCNSGPTNGSPGCDNTGSGNTGACADGGSNIANSCDTGISAVAPCNSGGSNSGAERNPGTGGDS